MLVGERCSVKGIVAGVVFRLRRNTCAGAKLTRESKKENARKVRRALNRSARAALLEELHRPVEDWTEQADVPFHNGRYASSVDFY